MNNEEEIKRMAREWAADLMRSAITKATEDQIENQMYFIECAAVHLLATIAYNHAMNKGKIGQIKSIMEIKELIEDELDWMANESMDTIYPGDAEDEEDDPILH